MPENVLQELTKLAATTGSLGWFANRMTGLTRVATEPRPLPVCKLVAKISRQQFATETEGAVRALTICCGQPHWQQSYTEADGFTRNWLDQYGWVNLVSPEGLFQSDEVRISIGYWGAGQRYKEHSHGPEEYYLVLAGQARFFSQGRDVRDVRAGEVVHHAPHQKHAIDMTPGPLLVAAFWRGDDLLKKSDLD